MASMSTAPGFGHERSIEGVGCSGEPDFGKRSILCQGGQVAEVLRQEGDGLPAPEPAGLRYCLQAPLWLI